jgi:hypothetical protein
LIFAEIRNQNASTWARFGCTTAAVYQTNGVDSALVARSAGNAEVVRFLCEPASTSMPPALRSEGMENDWKQTIRIPHNILLQFGRPPMIETAERGQGMKTNSIL